MYVHVSVTTVTPASVRAAIAPDLRDHVSTRVRIERHDRRVPLRRAWRARSNSATERCGVPTLTAAIGPAPTVVSSSRAARRRSTVTTISRSGTAAAERILQRGRLRRDAHRVEHRDARPEEAAAAPSAFSRSSLVSGGSPTIDGNGRSRVRPDDVTDARRRDLVVRAGVRGCRPQHGTRSGRAGASSRCSPASGTRPVIGRADVDEVAVAVRPCAQHRVREHDRVRLGPGDVLAERRARGRAGTARRSTSGGSPSPRTRPSGGERPRACRASSRTRSGWSRSSDETFSVVGTATRAPPASSVSAKSSPAGPWYRQLSTCADVTSIRRSASPDAGHRRPRSAWRGPRPRRARHRAISRSTEGRRQTAIGARGSPGSRPGRRPGTRSRRTPTDRHRSSDARYVVENTAENSLASSRSCSIALTGTYGPDVLPVAVVAQGRGDVVDRRRRSPGARLRAGRPRTAPRSARW